VRTSTKEVDRRRKPRFRIDRHGKLNVGGRVLDVQIENCSEGGARVVSETPFDSISGSVELEITGIAVPVRGRILSIHGNGMHLKFEFDAAGDKRFAEAFAPVVRGLEPLASAA